MLTDGIGQIHKGLFLVFIKYIVAPQLGEVTLRNGFQAFHLYCPRNLLSASKQFITRFFSNGYGLAGYKTVINVCFAFDQDAVNGNEFLVSDK